MGEFLYKSLSTANDITGCIDAIELPISVKNNLRREFLLRPYQEDALRRFMFYYDNGIKGKQQRPWHLFFHMATGSGKTLVMAGLVLYLYEKGYRNFLFYVNSDTIVQKTRDNFLNPYSSKYLFGERITFDNREVEVREVKNFNEADEDNINMKFCTVQKLHSDLTTFPTENDLSWEDFENRKIVMIADEADYFNAETRAETEKANSYERTTTNILHRNPDNIMLGFSATMDYETPAITGKYEDKTIIRYDLRQFRLDKYSKEINLLAMDSDIKTRVLVALVLNLYRQEIASRNGINLKPVVLFKSKTINESKENEKKFHQLIENLLRSDIDSLRGSDAESIRKAFEFFDNHEISSEDIVQRTQEHFAEVNCLNANDEKEVAKMQLVLNSLEDGNNPVRAVFAVDKLDRGWDVLNLFDIVRMYEGQNSGGSNKGKVGKTTRSEAQLIGRGARYFPFMIEDGQEKYKRKYDEDAKNDLRILETLFYHTRFDNRYISEIKNALVKDGIMEEDRIEVELKLKPDFKKTYLYKNGRVFVNKRFAGVGKRKPTEELVSRKQGITYELSSYSGREIAAFGDSTQELTATEPIDIHINEMPMHVVRYALSTNKFFNFDNLKEYYKELDSIKTFIVDENLLGGFFVRFKGTKEGVAHISNVDYLKATQKLLEAIEKELKATTPQYTVSDFNSNTSLPFYEVFKDKKLTFAKDKNDPDREKGQIDFLADKDWYAFNANYGTSEERKFVEMFAARVSALSNDYEDIYLVRNEKEVKIYDEEGNTFEPDFLLYAKRKGAHPLIYQIFIEPKGAHLEEKDRWKEDLLIKIRDDKHCLHWMTDSYRITGVPFYNSTRENEFAENLQSILGEEISEEWK